MMKKTLKNPLQKFEITTTRNINPNPKVATYCKTYSCYLNAART